MGFSIKAKKVKPLHRIGINGVVLEVLRRKGFRAEARSNNGFGKGWEAEYLAKNKGF